MVRQVAPDPGAYRLRRKHRQVAPATVPQVRAHTSRMRDDRDRTSPAPGGSAGRLIAERVGHSWLSFGRTTTLDRFTSRAGLRAIRERLERAEASVRLAHAAGVRIAAGSDFGGGSTRAGQLAWEVEALVRAGLEPWQALGAATWRGGQLLGVRDAGRIREGGPADFVLVHGDPLSDPAALWRVWRVSWA